MVALVLSEWARVREACCLRVMSRVGLAGARACLLDKHRSLAYACFLQDPAFSLRSCCLSLGRICCTSRRRRHTEGLVHVKAVHACIHSYPRVPSSHGCLSCICVSKSRLISMCSQTMHFVESVAHSLKASYAGNDYGDRV